jgi:hypothetical protein
MHTKFFKFYVIFLNTNYHNIKLMLRQDQRVESRLAVGKRFKRFGPEEEKTVRKADVKSREPEHFQEIWSSFYFEPYGNLRDDHAQQLCYETVYEFICSNGISYSSEEVEQTSVLMEVMQHKADRLFPWKAGLILSVLVNTGLDSEYSIYISSLTERVCLIGYRNQRDMTVNGDVEGLANLMSSGRLIAKGHAGVFAGLRMSGGELVLEGGVGDYVGCNLRGGTVLIEGDAQNGVGSHMDGGSIIVNGNTGDEIGEFMRNSSITVKGNAGDRIGVALQDGAIITIEGDTGDKVGEYMHGGEIHLLGDYKSISSEAFHGKIYHKGKLIFNK